MTNEFIPYNPNVEQFLGIEEIYLEIANGKMSGLEFIEQMTLFALMNRRDSLNANRAIASVQRDRSNVVENGSHI